MLEINPATLRNWVEREEIGTGARPGTTSNDAVELARLRKENADSRSPPTSPDAHPDHPDDRASLSELRHRIDEVAVPRLVGALDLPALDTDLLLRPTGR